MRGGARPGAGRPRKPKPPLVERTPGERVAILTAVGTPLGEIALGLSLSVQELRQRYGRELQDGPAIANEMVLAALRARAAEGFTGAARELARVERRGLRTGARHG